LNNKIISEKGILPRKGEYATEQRRLKGGIKPQLGFPNMGDSQYFKEAICYYHQYLVVFNLFSQ